MRDRSSAVVAAGDDELDQQSEAVISFPSEREWTRYSLFNKHLNNILEQDHRAIKRIIKPMTGFKDFRCARIILAGIELMHMIRKEQMKDDGVGRTVAAQFYLLSM